MVALAGSLKVNASLERLDADQNMISNEGAIAMSEGLKENYTLKSLDLCHNLIQDEGAIALSRAMEENSSLGQLCLFFNEISGIIKDSIQSSMRKYPRDRLVEAANNGNEMAQFRLGRMLDLGKGNFPQDLSKAVIWYKRAAQKGNARACLHLGLMYKFGRGVDQSESVALECFRAAAVQGHVDAIFWLYIRNGLNLSSWTFDQNELIYLSILHCKAT